MADVYEIAVKLTMMDAVGPAMGLLANRILGVDRAVSGLITKFQRLSAIQKTALVGGVSLVAGAASLKVMDDMADKGNKFLKIQQDMAAAGVKQVDIQGAVAKAYEMSQRFRNISITQALESINDQRMVFGSAQKAIEHAEIGARLTSFLQAYQGGAHAGESPAILQQVMAGVKSAEIAGKITPAEMDEHIKQLTAMTLAYGNNVKISDYLKAQRTAGVALRNTSDSFRYGMFPALVQENGVNAGTMMMTAFNKVVAGVGNREQSLQNMRDIGFLQDDQLNFNKQGKAIGIKNMAGLTNSMDAAMNFGDWVMKTLKPKIEGQMDKEGVTGDLQRNIRESQLISSIFPDRNAAKAITEILQQFTKLTKDADLMAAARASLNVDSYIDQSYNAQKQAMGAQIDSFETNLGKNFVPAFTDMLRSINDVLASFNASVEKMDPETLHKLGTVMVGVAAGLTALGGVLVGGALLAAIGPAGWLIVGMAALTATLAANPMASGRPRDERDDPKTDPISKIQALLAELDSIGPKIDDKDINDAITQWLMALGKVPMAMYAVAGELSTAISSIPEKVMGAIKGMADSIGTAMSSAIKSILGVATATGGANVHGNVGGSAPGTVNLIPGVHSKNAKAGGGNVYGGHPYLVGEAGPELFVPGSTGDIIPSHRLGSPAPPRGSQVVEIHNYTTLDGEVVHRSVVRRMVAEMNHPTQSPHFDSSRNWMSPSMQFSAG